MQISPQDIFQDVSDGALVLTANRRLFRHLREKYDRWMRDQGGHVWPTPQIYSYEGWLSLCLEQLNLGWRLLSTHQEQCLWEGVISELSRGTELELLQLPQTAERAIQAHHLMTEYGATLDAYPLTDDQRAFSSWRLRVMSDCRSHDLFDKSFVPEQVCKAISDGRIGLPPTILLVGFDQLTPGLVRLQTVAGACGSVCRECGWSGPSAGRVLRFAATDKNDEIESAARWTRHLLETGAESIGIVVPDLVRQRTRIERVFREQVAPESSLVGENEETVFSLSLGSPLADQGVVHAALEILQTGYLVDIDRVSFLLRTPYLGGSVEEADARALFERRLRTYRQPDFRLPTLLREAGGTAGLSLFTSVLAILQKGLTEERKTPGGWARVFSGQLSDLGWPGDKTIASSEFQALKSFRQNVLEVLPTLDRILPLQTRGQALNLVRRMAAATDFQLEGPTGQVQVVGLLESSGLSFDHLWVMGLEDRVLPASPQPNPFLPYRLQDDLQMPRSNVEREEHFARQIVDRLLAASSDIVLSYPRREGDMTLRPSPLIRDLGVEEQPLMTGFCDLLHRSSERRVSLEKVDDRRGRPLDGASVSGGTGLLKDQAHCPFRAYVRHRLQCRALDEAVPGIGPMTRGDLVHLALEKIWNQLRDQRRLVALTDSQRTDLIREQARTAVNDYYAGRMKPADTLLNLETERLEHLLSGWFSDVEMKRDEFTVIATEKELETDIGPLKVKLKVDRLDCLADGSRIVIDYKTGRQLSAEDFLSRPLIEPQLPVYAVSNEEQAADGIAFAQVRKDGYRFVGLVRHQGLLGNVKDLSRFRQTGELGIGDWSELLSFWNGEIRRLAADFAAGIAEVKPFSSDQSCRYCDLPGICRIDEVVSMRGGE